MQKAEGYFEFEDVGLTVEGSRDENGDVSVSLKKLITGGPTQRIFLNIDQAHALYNLLDVVLPEKEE